MTTTARRVLAALLAAMVLFGLAACYSDTEVQRTKLPNIDGSDKPAEKNK